MSKEIIPIQQIAQIIRVIRGEKALLDFDLAPLYGVTTGNLNKAMRRNRERFPSDFMFQLTKEEYDGLRFQIETLENGNLLDEKAAQKRWDDRGRVGFKR